MLTGGQVADCTAGGALLDRLPDCDVRRADKGYDANAIRRLVEERGTNFGTSAPRIDIACDSVAGAESGCA